MVGCITVAEPATTGLRTQSRVPAAGALALPRVQCQRARSDGAALGARDGQPRRRQGTGFEVWLSSSRGTRAQRPALRLHLCVGARTRPRRRRLCRVKARALCRCEL